MWSHTDKNRFYTVQFLYMCAGHPCAGNHANFCQAAFGFVQFLSQPTILHCLQSAVHPLGSLPLFFSLVAGGATTLKAVDVAGGLHFYPSEKIFPEVPKPKTLKAHKFTRTSFSFRRAETKGVQSMEMHRVQLGMDLT